MTTCINSFGLIGIDAFNVGVEVDLSRGLPGFNIVGLPDNAIKESKDRVRSAMKNTGFQFPMQRIVVNLAPADIEKSGSTYDLPIFIGLLIASGQIKCDVSNCAFVGEISLMGQVKKVKGILPMIIFAKESKIKKVFIPKENENEVKNISGIELYPIENLKQLYAHLTGENEIFPMKAEDFYATDSDYLIDFSEIKGQHRAKRAAEIAAAGGHNIILIGPPGSGKSMIAKRLVTILPKLSFEEAIETTKIYSVAGKIEDKIISSRPFRSPHLTISSVALCGGGRNATPGEISLSHNGVLFLDELTEFSKGALESLRQPLEDNIISIARVKNCATYPANFMLVCAMNPCRCGYLGHPTKECKCTEREIKKYISKISGPVMDRIDLHVEVPAVSYDEMHSDVTGESSAQIKKRVERARQIQLERYKNTNIFKNSDLTSKLIKEFCKIDEQSNSLLKESFEKMSMSARGYEKVLKIARTIADLEESEDIQKHHVFEALTFRTLDKKYYL